MDLPAKAKDTESPGVFVYAEEPPQKSVTLFVVQDPVYFNVESLSSTVAFLNVALSTRLTNIQISLAIYSPFRANRNPADNHIIQTQHSRSKIPNQHFMRCIGELRIARKGRRREQRGA